MLASRQRRGTRPCTHTFPTDSSGNTSFRCTDASASVQGEVFRVQDLTLDQEVALKFLPDDLAADPQRLALFHKEVRIARQVTHRNVCRMYDIGEVVCLR